MKAALSEKPLFAIQLPSTVTLLEISEEYPIRESLASFLPQPL
jgi:hypothetical protein